MNIFVLHGDPYVAASMHGDRHVVKMPLELAQVLSTVHRLKGTRDDSVLDKYGIYKASYQHHPIVKWACNNAANYAWALCMFDGLCREFRFRRHKGHKCEELMEGLRVIPGNLPGWEDLDSSLTNSPLCMPDTFKTNNIFLSYRAYYLYKWCQGKVEYNWGRPPPDWLRVMVKGLLDTRAGKKLKRTRRKVMPQCLLPVDEPAPKKRTKPVRDTIDPSAKAYIQSKKPKRKRAKVPGTIQVFTGEYAFLNNANPCPIKLEDGRTYPSALHAFYASATFRAMDRRAIRQAKGASKLRSIWTGIDKHTLRGDWDKVRDDVKLDILRRKFEDETLAWKLVGTGDALLNDKLHGWNVELMQVREELKLKSK